MTGLISFWTWPAWCWPWIGGLAAVMAEAWFRTHPEVPYVRQWVPLILAVPINYSVFRLMIAAPSLLAGFLSFSTATLTLRIALTLFVLREATDLRTWAALGLALAAKALMR